MHLSPTIEQLAELIRESRFTVALTGAGVSVPSGSPTSAPPRPGSGRTSTRWRSPTSTSSNATRRFWSYYRPRFQSLGDKRPNRAHEALAELERRGLLEGVITQNIDRLHRAAGSREVVEVHGSIATSSCRECGASFGLEEMDALFDERRGRALRRLRRAGQTRRRALRRDAARGRRWRGRTELAERAELMLCVGSSLAVYPVAGLPQLTLERGGRLAIVTKGPTPYDGDAAVKLEGEVDEELVALLDALG